MEEDHTTATQPVDLLICGSGSAGLCCALWLAVYNDCIAKRAAAGLSKTPKYITYRVLESRGGPLQIGQADGVQCRTCEIYESFGLDNYLRDEGYWVNEVAFWAAENNNAAQPNGDVPGRRRIVRTGRTADVQPGLSHQPHVILNQARINELMIEKAKALKGNDVSYGWAVKGVEVDEATNPNYPVEVDAEGHGGRTIFRAKYVLGSDGAHSQVRHSLQIPMEGDSTNAVWGVMDFYPRTNFPDVRKKATVRSDHGTLLIIPREGDSMIRTYIELPQGTNPKSVKLQDLQQSARLAFYPYDIEFLVTKWWSAYAIGQRVAKSVVDASGRIFLAGDACHTHSPKAGQGMNASLQDGYNFGWKVGAVLTGQADASLLDTYVRERHQYARELIEFDRYFAKMFSSEGKAGKRASPEEFNEAFVRAGVFTAGMAAKYEQSSVIATDISKQELAVEVVVGQRLPSAQVVRMSDSKPFQLLKLLRSDSRWRILVFAGDAEDQETLQRLNRVGDYLASSESPLVKFISPGEENDNRIETLVVLHGDRTKVEFDQIHDAFKPQDHNLALVNLHKIYFDDDSWNHGHGHAYQTLGIDPRKGCFVVARPDQYVSAVLDLSDETGLSSVFSSFLKPASRQ